MKDKDTPESAPGPVREQAQQYVVHLEPGERIAALEGERKHMATKADITRLEKDIARLEGKMDKRFDAMDARLDAMDTRLDAMDKRLDAMDARFDAMDKRLDAMDARIGRLEARMDVQIAVNERSEKMMRWALGLIVTLLVIVVASLITGVPVGPVGG